MELPERERYEHNSLCDGKTFDEPNERGLKRCLDCSGIFDENGKGVAIQDKRFDTNYIPPPPKET